MLQCPVCKNIYLNPAELMFHMAWHRQQAELQSIACSSAATQCSSISFNASISSSGGSSSTTITTRNCAKNMNGTSTTARQVKITGTGTKSMNSTRITSANTCKCPVCGKTFTRHWLLQGHMRTHSKFFPELKLKFQHPKIVLVINFSYVKNGLKFFFFRLHLLFIILMFSLSLEVSKKKEKKA